MGSFQIQDFDTIFFNNNINIIPTLNQINDFQLNNIIIKIFYNEILLQMMEDNGIIENEEEFKKNISYKLTEGFNYSYEIFYINQFIGKYLICLLTEDGLVNKTEFFLDITKINGKYEAGLIIYKEFKLLR